MQTIFKLYNVGWNNGIHIYIRISSATQQTEYLYKFIYISHAFHSSLVITIGLGNQFIFFFIVFTYVPFYMYLSIYRSVLTGKTKKIKKKLKNYYEM